MLRACDDPRLQRAVRVHLLHRWGEDEVNPREPEFVEVLAEGVRILVEVFTRRELEGVHEDGYDDGFAEFVGAPHQREMSLVEGAHRRHQHDVVTIRQSGPGLGYRLEHEGAGHSLRPDCSWPK